MISGRNAMEILGALFFIATGILFLGLLYYLGNYIEKKYIIRIVKQLESPDKGRRLVHDHIDFDR
jgi:hypothetical protein